MSEPAARPLKVKRQTTAKRGCEPGENEDSSAENVSQGRFSVSDGASTAARSEVWSRLLTSTFVRGDDPLDRDVLAELRRAWWTSVFDEDLTWFAREKLSQGSAATFLGLWIDGDRYEVTAVGDSCLFHISDQELVLAAPLDDWTQFSRFPNLVSTDPPTAHPPVTIADFAWPEHKVAVFCDGWQHHHTPEQQAEDKANATPCGPMAGRSCPSGAAKSFETFTPASPRFMQAASRI
jgi:hypothetical protein